MLKHLQFDKPSLILALSGLGIINLAILLHFVIGLPKPFTTGGLILGTALALAGFFRQRNR